MKNKLILVTGATQGIGKITATELAKQGHHIVIHGRSQTKLNEVRQEIINQSGNNNVETIVADLLSLKAIEQMGSKELNSPIILKSLQNSNTQKWKLIRQNPWI